MVNYGHGDDFKEYMVCVIIDDISLVEYTQGQRSGFAELGLVAHAGTHAIRPFTAEPSHLLCNLTRPCQKLGLKSRSFEPLIRVCPCDIIVPWWSHTLSSHGVSSSKG